MTPEFLSIQPNELKFTFEVKKQSSCAVQLVNNTNQYVAYKVKTTSPKKYCVRPNIGIVLPNATCDFTDMQCKDKFLIQSTVVPFGSSEEDITATIFAKESGKFIQENKLRVVFVSPSHSPVLLPIDGTLKLGSDFVAPVTKGAVRQESDFVAPVIKGAVRQESDFEAPVIKGDAKQEPASEALITKGALKQEPASEALITQGALKQEPASEALITKGALKQEPASEALITKGALKQEPASEALITKGALKQEPAFEALLFNGSSKKGPAYEDSVFQDQIPSEIKDSNVVDKNVEELNCKIRYMESELNELVPKLTEAEKTIIRLREEKSATIRERDVLKREVVVIRSRKGAKVQVGFPFLFVCFVAIVSMYLGYLLRG
ncbi:vesicle-associated protein 2-2-like isoform X2 [Aristolochia californica]|uniref:vesicle-associated protein 2-2-like isoform X2 n=1 Tax=Aristolochia californica TaxID=171875 RepID=UPI0035DEA60F